MARTAAQRQADYRARRAGGGKGGNGERCLSLWVETEAALGLARLARRAGVTQRAFIERLVKAEDGKVVARLEPDTAEWEKYFGVSRSEAVVSG